MPIPRTKPFWLAILGGVLIVNLAVGFSVYSTETRSQGGNADLGKLNVMMEALHLIRQDYVDADHVSNDALLENAIRGMVETLDPFSSYLDEGEFGEMREITEGKFGGLGVTLRMRNDRLTVIAPMPGSPAEKAGLHPGDQIIKVNGEAAAGLEFADIMSRLKGEPGTKVALALFRPVTNKNFDVTVTRAEIDVPSVESVQMLDAQTGYLRIVDFSDNTAPSMEKAVRKLVDEKKARALILDLRNNPGGILDGAVDVCGEFLPRGSLVVYTEGRRPSQKQEFFTTDGYRVPAELPVVILINKNTASAAEIVSACLQDWGRAVLVGERSFGKGSVQDLVPLSDGGALRLTIAHYYTPSRRIIHEHGVEPDVTIVQTGEESDRLFEPDEETGKTPPPVADKDRQLQRALETVKNYESYRKNRKPVDRKNGSTWTARSVLPR